MPLFWFVVVFVVGGFAPLLWLGNDLSTKASHRANTLLESLTAVYNESVEQAIANQILTTNGIDLDLEAIQSQLLTILRPQLDALIGTINANKWSGVVVKTPANPVFANVAALTESLYVRCKRDETPVTAEEAERLERALLTAIEADLQSRRLRLNV